MAVLIVILAVAFLLLLTGWLSSDLVAVLILLTLIVSGLLTVEEAFAGFGSPVIVTVASLFIVSGGL